MLIYIYRYNDVYIRPLARFCTTWWLLLGCWCLTAPRPQSTSWHKNNIKLGGEGGAQTGTPKEQPPGGAKTFPEAVPFIISISNKINIYIYMYGCPQPIHPPALPPQTHICFILLPPARPSQTPVLMNLRNGSLRDLPPPLCEHNKL